MRTSYKGRNSGKSQAMLRATVGMLAISNTRVVSIVPDERTGQKHIEAAAKMLTAMGIPCATGPCLLTTEGGATLKCITPEAQATPRIYVDLDYTLAKAGEAY